VKVPVAAPRAVELVAMAAMTVAMVGLVAMMVAMMGVGVVWAEMKAREPTAAAMMAVAARAPGGMVDVTVVAAVVKAVVETRFVRGVGHIHGSDPV
jgi:uncharacterized membrane protein AbrB (regulator of aidB expression)